MSTTCAFSPRSVERRVTLTYAGGLELAPRYPAEGDENEFCPFPERYIGTSRVRWKRRRWDWRRHPWKCIKSGTRSSQVPSAVVAWKEKRQQCIPSLFVSMSYRLSTVHEYWSFDLMTQTLATKQYLEWVSIFFNIRCWRECWRVTKRVPSLVTFCWKTVPSQTSKAASSRGRVGIFLSLTEYLTWNEHHLVVCVKN